jgi:hypothetical protein
MDNLYSKDQMLQNLYLEQPTEPVPTPNPAPSTTSNTGLIEQKYILYAVVGICGIIILVRHR